MVRSTPHLLRTGCVASRSIATDLRRGRGRHKWRRYGLSRSQPGGSRRDAGFVGASLSADVPLASIVVHPFLLCQGWFNVSLNVFGVGQGDASLSRGCGVPVAINGDTTGLRLVWGARWQRSSWQQTLRYREATDRPSSKIRTSFVSSHRADTAGVFP